MRKITKSILALALLMVGVTGVKAETLDQVYEIDYSDYTSFPFYVMGFTPDWDGGIMVDGGSSGWHQYFIADGIPTTVNKNYRVKAQVKASAQIKLNINMGWGWGDGEQMGASVTIPQSDEFVEVVWDYEEVGGTSCNLVAQPGVSSTTIEWKKLTVYEVIPDGPVIEPTWVSLITNGDLEGTDASCYSSTQPGVGGPWMVAIEDGIGKEGSRGIKVVSCDQADIPACQLNPADENSYQWATQFFISSKYKVPSGKKIHLKFDYRADVNGDADVQAHGAPGAYNWWNFTGGCSFKGEWQTYDKTIKLDDNQSPTSNPFYTAAFNLGKNKVATTFYFDNIVMEAAVNDPETMDGFVTSPAIPATPTPSVTVGADGVGTFVANYSMKLDDNVTAYAVKYEDAGYVSLTGVTEIPLHTAVIVEAASGTYPQELARVLALGTDNDLLESDGKVAADGTIYVLANGSNGVGFYKLADGGNVPAGKGYLQVAATSREFIGINGETTAIKALEKAIDNGAIFNLSGQQVAQPTKGLYIVNGKKVILK